MKIEKRSQEIEQIKNLNDKKAFEENEIENETLNKILIVYRYETEK